MVFNSESYDDKDFEEVIENVWTAIEKFNPETYGYAWADDIAPRFQLAPLGHRGYIEAKPVKSIVK